MDTRIGFLTDYGTRDGFVAVCHGIIATIAPEVRVHDLSHDVPPQDVRHGAAVLARVVRYFPPAVQLAVVDPGVGTARRGLALRAGHSLLVGPDNGLLLPAAEVLGGVVEAYALTNPDRWLPTTDATFHGRDVFAPVAAFLAAGGALEDVGTPTDPAGLVRLPAVRLEVTEDAPVGEVTYVDVYGNVQLAGGPSELAAAADLARHGQVAVRAGTVSARAAVATTFGDVPGGELLVYQDADGRLAIAVNGGSAARRLGVTTGDVVRIERPT
jgi:S-adenosylmethionine hydrolase